MVFVKYEDAILAAYDHIGMKPRDNQLEVVNDILTKFLDDGCSNVIASLPTGTGKTPIALVVSYALREITKTNELAFISMHTNILMEQYKNTFEHVKDICFIKGAGNYNCDWLTLYSGQPQNAECCTGDCPNSFMDDCVFRKIKEKAQNAKTIVSNFHYWMIKQEHGKREPYINIFDEAQNLNNSFVEHHSINVTDKTFDRFDFLYDADKKYFSRSYRTFTLELRNALKCVNEKNFLMYLMMLEKYLLKPINFQHIIDDTERLIKAARENKNLSKKELNKEVNDLTKTLRNATYFNNLKEAVDRIDPSTSIFGLSENGFYLKPAIIGDYWQANMRPAKYNLFISATISQQYVESTIKLKGKTAFIKHKSAFPPENKKVIIYKPLNLNYKTMQDNETIKQLNERCLEIVKMQSKYKGIISTPTFTLTKTVSEYLSLRGIDVFEHKSGEKLENIIGNFKSYNKPSVLISPMLFEGIDLPDDLARYQILTKCPYASLQDNVVKYILNHYPELYQFQTLLKIIQFFGRGVRNKDDWSNIFVLDTNVIRLLNDRANVWSDEYKLIKVQ